MCFGHHPLVLILKYEAIWYSVHSRPVGCELFGFGTKPGGGSGHCARQTGCPANGRGSQARTTSYNSTPNDQLQTGACGTQARARHDGTACHTHSPTDQECRRPGAQAERSGTHCPAPARGIEQYENRLLHSTCLIKVVPVYCLHPLVGLTQSKYQRVGLLLCSSSILI